MCRNLFLMGSEGFMLIFRLMMKLWLLGLAKISCISGMPVLRPSQKCMPLKMKLWLLKLAKIS